MRHHRTNPSGKWKIESGTDFTTGKPTWTTTPPRWVYRPHAEAKRSFDTYDEALGHVLTSKGRRPIVIESKTRIGEWFWLHPDGTSGWETERHAAHAKANGTYGESEVA